jgi:hypothetical protein
VTRAQDWLKYLKDPNSFDMDHFAQSLVDTSLEYSIDLDLFFSFTPQRADVIERIKKLKSSTEFNGLYYLPKSKEMITESAARQKLWDCIRVSANHSRLKGEDNEARELESMNIVTTHDIDTFHEANTDVSLDRNFSFDRLHECFKEYAFDTSEVYFAVFESVLNLTTYPMVTDYLLSSAVKYPVDFTSFYDLYIGGASYSVLTDKIILYVPNPNQ